MSSGHLFSLAVCGVLLLSAQDAQSALPDWGVSASVDARTDIPGDFNRNVFRSCSGTHVAIQGVCTSSPGGTVNSISNVTSLTAITATAAASSHSAGTQTFFNPTRQVHGTADSNGTASGSLATGLMRWSTSASFNNFGSGSTSSQVQMYDTITLDPSTFGSSRITVGISAILSGSYKNATVSFLMQGQSSVDNYVGSVRYTQSDFTTVYDISNPGVFTVATKSGDFSSFGPSNFMALVDVSAANPVIDLRFLVGSSGGTSGGQGSFTDFTHTTRLSLVLPAGVTYTSASGVFLTATENAVPEPSTWALLVAGFAAVGVGLRKRRTGTMGQFI